VVLAGLEDPCIPSPYPIENDSNFVVKFLSRYLVTAKGIAQLAAVIGRQFAYALLQRVSQVVVCLCAADNVSRSLPSRLTHVKQPVIASHIGVPVPGEALCTTPQTHLTRVIPHSSCVAVA